MGIIKGSNAYINVATIDESMALTNGVVPAETTPKLYLVMAVGEGSALPVPQRMFFLQSAAEITLVPGDKVLAIDTNDDYPATGLDANVETGKIDVTTQRNIVSGTNSVYKTEISDGVQSLSGTLTGYLDDQYNIQTDLMKSYFGEVVTSADGQTITFTKPKPTTRLLIEKIINTVDTNRQRSIVFTSAITNFPLSHEVTGGAYTFDLAVSPDDISIPTFITREK